MTKVAIVVGASFGLGRSLAFRLAQKGIRPILIARSTKELSTICEKINQQYNVNASFFSFDLNLPAKNLMDQFYEILNALDHKVFYLFITAVLMNKEDQVDSQDYERLLSVNFFGTVSVIQCYNKYCAENKITGKIGISSSIAVPVPRNRNVFYTAGKAALESYVRSLQVATTKSVEVTLFRIGFMKTRLFKKKQFLFLASSPDKVANAMIQKIEKNGRMYYLPFFWQWIVLLFKLMPWFIYKRLKF